MAYLFIDTGVADLGLTLFSEKGDLLNYKYIKTSAKHTRQIRTAQIWRELQLITMMKKHIEIIFEEYVFHDDSTGKSKKGANTKFTNGVVAGFALANEIPWEIENNGAWRGIWSRIRLAGKDPEIPPEILANEHLTDSYKMGISILTRKKGMKEHDRIKEQNRSTRYFKG